MNKKFILKVITSNKVNDNWLDETIASVLDSNHLEYFLDELNEKLFDKNDLLIRKFCFMLRLQCKDFLNSKPIGNSWNIIIDFLYNNKEKITDSLFLDVIDLLFEWCRILSIEKEMPEISSKVALLSLYIFDKIKTEKQSKYDDSFLIKLCNIIIKTSSSIENELTAIFENDVFNIDKHNRYKYINIFINISLEDEINSAFFAKYFPDLLIKLALDTWIEKKKDDENDTFIQQRIEIDWGIKFSNEPKYASGLIPPFEKLFSFHYIKAIDFVIKLSNITSEIYVNSAKNYNKYKNSNFLKIIDKELGFEDTSHHLEPHNIQEVILELNDNTTKNQYSSLCMWEAYRGTSVANGLIASALMALENWLIEFVSNNKKDKVEYIYNYILKNSDSVLTTAVLASVATGFPKLVVTSSFPILKEISFYFLDIVRSIQEHAASFVFGFNINEEYKKERKKSLEREWRNKTLKNLCLDLQLTDLSNNIIKIIDDSKLKYKDDKEILDFLYNMDIRNYKPIEKDGDNLIFSIDTKQTDEDIENQKKQDLYLEDITLSLWGDSMLKNEGNENKYFNSFEDALLKLKSIIESNENSSSLVDSFGIIRASTALVQKYHNEISEKDLNIIFIPILKYTLEGNSFMTNEAFEVLPIIYSYLETEEKQLIKKIIIKNLLSQHKQTSFPTAVGIQKYLWQIDEDFAKQCFYNTIYFSQNGLYRDFYSNDIKDSLNIFLTESKDTNINELTLDEHNYVYLYSSFIMCLTKENGDNYTDFINKILSLIIEKENDKYYSISSDDIIKQFVRYIFMIEEEKAKQFYSIFNDGCSKQPSFMRLFLLRLEEYGETNNNTSIFWSVYASISEAMIDITMKHLDRKYDLYTKQLIRHMIFSDMPWQKQDLEKQYIKHGKECIINFAKKTCSNINIFEGLASLMYHFNNIFFEDGIKILSSIEKEKISDYLAIEITRSYLELSISSYLTKTGIEIREDLHNSCLTILEKMIDKGSSKALKLKDYLITSKRII